MKQIVITKSGDYDVLKIQETDDLSPAKGEIKIRVKASGINFADILARKGLYPDAPKLPCVIGYEVSGVVENVGEGVTEFDVGQEVLALTRFGGYAETVNVPQYQVFERSFQFFMETTETDQCVRGNGSNFQKDEKVEKVSG